MKGIIFDIQYGAMYDGPGLRTCVFFKGCPLSCKWCQNPESQLSRPQLFYHAERCISCGKCAKACSKGVLAMQRANNVRPYEIENSKPMRNEENCNLCGACAKACSQQAMEIIGFEITTSELLSKVQRDKLFYESSKGGVTISGGEPAMQDGFLIDILKATKKDNIHTAIETCGHFNPEIIDKLIDVTDLFLFDIKHINPTQHKKYTGMTNEHIKRNFKKILKKAGPEKIVPRIPLIPSFNTDNDSICNIVDYIKSAGYSGEVHLMPYNPLTKTKWEKIGRANEYRNFGELTAQEIKIITQKLKQSKFKVVCNN